jgi:RNA-directed DNA polymerase
MTLDGLEGSITGSVPRGSKVNVIRYADDFIVTGESKEILQEKVIPAIGDFLEERGLNLSREKTRITRIDEGFDFLGQHLRKYGDKLIITPSKSSVKAIVAKTRKIMKSNIGQRTSKMIWELSSVIRGWANYHRHACSKITFAYVDKCIFKNLWRWEKRRHPNRSTKWLRKRYFRTVGSHNWCFFATDKTGSGGFRTVELPRASAFKIVRHVKIRAKANPYEKEWQEYLRLRRTRKFPVTYVAVP